MTNSEFIHHFVNTHLAIKTGQSRLQIPGFDVIENRWLALHGLGKLETFRYLYSECQSHADFIQWLQNIRGIDACAD